MRADIHLYIHNVTEPGVMEKLEAVRLQLVRLTTGVGAMSAELDRVKTEVAENTTVVQSAIVLLGQLGQIIRDNASDPAALTALADELDSNANALAAAVAANTPAAPEA